VWLLGLANAVKDGFDPGYWGTYTVYPLVPLIKVSLRITVEAAVLYGIVRPGSYNRSWKRLLIALVLFAFATSRESDMTDQPGLFYSNGAFLDLVVLALLLALLAYAFTGLRRRLRPSNPEHAA